MTENTPEIHPEMLDTHEHEPVAKPKPVAAVSQPTDTVPRTTLNYLVIAIVFFAVGVVIGAVTFGNSISEDKITQAVQTAFANSGGSTTTAGISGDAMESAILNVLIAEGLATPLEDMTQMVDDDPYLGDADAPIVIVEFSAYACPYCARHFEETFVPLLENYGQYVRYVYRDFPSINPSISYPASLAANCANEQGQFWDFHNELFANQSSLSDGFYISTAEDMGMDVDAFTECFETQQYITEVESDFETGIALGISGTPSFYINGRFHSGARPYAYFERIIQRELDALGIEY